LRNPDQQTYKKKDYAKSFGRIVMKFWKEGQKRPIITVTEVKINVNKKSVENNL